MVPADRNGSISAEHGLGFKKANFINYSKTNEAVSLMRRFKDILDPKVMRMVVIEYWFAVLTFAGHFESIQDFTKNSLIH